MAEALKILAARGVECEVAIAGAGELESVFDTIKRPFHVVKEGWLSTEDLSGLMGRSSVFVLPSRVEGVPLALLEAMSHGMACVASSVGGVPDVIADGENGLLVEPEDSSGLADAMHRLLVDEQLRITLGRAARRFVSVEHSVDTVRARLFEVYASLGFAPTREDGA